LVGPTEATGCGRITSRPVRGRQEFLDADNARADDFHIDGADNFRTEGLFHIAPVTAKGNDAVAPPTDGNPSGVDHVGRQMPLALSRIAGDTAKNTVLSVGQRQQDGPLGYHIAAYPDADASQCQRAWAGFILAAPAIQLAKQVATAFAAGGTGAAVLSSPDLERRRFPIPPSTGKFGAVYTHLHYYETWENLFRFGPYPDVVVGFDQLFGSECQFPRPSLSLFHLASLLADAG